MIARGLLIAIGLALFVALLSAEEGEPDAFLLRARILQLETQAAQLTVRAAFCEAQAAVTRQAQTQADWSHQQSVLEREAGRAIDFSVTPPVYKAK